MTTFKWDNRFLALAEHVASWSKDPSTQVGAVLVSLDRKKVVFGYNGFPQGIADDERLHDREAKLKHVIHAEMNAVLNAGGSVKGYTLYTWPFMTCDRCAAHMIQSGVVRVVAPAFIKSSWKQTFRDAAAMYDEAGVEAVVKLRTSGKLIPLLDYLHNPPDAHLHAA